MRPAPTDFASAYGGYLSLVEDTDDIVSVIEAQSSETQKLLASLNESRAGYRYADGKWSIREVIGHVADTERILGYRALSIARGETQPLPGFDENDYVRNASFDEWKLGDLAEQYALVRRSHIVLFRNLPPESWERRGVANGCEITVNALAWIIAGHERHHVKVLRERYGV